MVTNIVGLSGFGWENKSSLSAVASLSFQLSKNEGQEADLPVVDSVDLSQDSGLDENLARSKAQAKVLGDRLKQACQTCKNRKYQDGSNDPGVSFKAAASIDPNLAASVVLGHEMEHVAHEQARAKQEGGKVLSQSVILHSAICPECGRGYIAGGTTTTKTLHSGNKNTAFSVGLPSPNATGGQLNQQI